MSAETLNFTIEQGTSWSATITPATPIDLSGYTGKCQMRIQADGNYPIIAEPTVTVAVGVLGIHTLSLTAAETALIPAFGSTVSSTSAYLYDVFMTKTVSTIKQDQGVITVIPSVTK